MNENVDFVHVASTAVIAGGNVVAAAGDAAVADDAAAVAVVLIVVAFVVGEVGVDLVNIAAAAVVATTEDLL